MFTIFIFHFTGIVNIMITNILVDNSHLCIAARKRMLRLKDGGEHSKSYHQPDAGLLRTLVLNWYDIHQRRLPWRKEWDGSKALCKDWLSQRAYEVWVSEIMLQQTQVVTVVQYYQRWMHAWPTIHSLAAASLEDVNKIWSGLGYYSRAKRLYQGAQIVVSKYGGHLPRTAEELEQCIPGIGPYTAGAIASIAFNIPSPLVDGNVIRVLSRLCAFGSDPKARSSVKWYWETAKEIVDPHMPGNFNQALMDLGATVCTPKAPQCNTCPLQSQCMAYIEQEQFQHISDTTTHESQTYISDLDDKSQIKVHQTNLKPSKDSSRRDIQDTPCTHCPMISVANIEDWPITRYPLKIERKPPRQQHCAVVVVERLLESQANQLLVLKSPETGLLAGLWDFPMTVISDIDPATCDNPIITSKPPPAIVLKKAMNQRIHEILGNVEIILQRDMGTVGHVFSHIKRTMHVQYVQIRSNDACVHSSTDGQQPSKRSKVEKMSTSNASEDIAWLTFQELESGKLGTPVTMKKVLAVFKKACAEGQPCKPPKLKAVDKKYKVDKSCPIIGSTRVTRSTSKLNK
ncbi:hypothetical protein RTP6_000075 [Batrachochytrium dendrobatidis]